MTDSANSQPEWTAPRVCVITLNWKNPSDTIECVASLKDALIPVEDIVVVDNGSGDDSVDRIRTAHSDVTLLEMPHNLGFAEGNNVGIRHALERGADYVLLLNNDTVVDPGLVPALLDAWNAVSAPGFIGARIYYHDDRNRIWMGMPRWNDAQSQFEFEGRDELDASASIGNPVEVAYTCGCALFTAASVVNEIGFMDERYFCYYEEVDWCFRAKAKGFRSFVAPPAKVWHKVSMSSGGKDAPAVRYYRTRNSLNFARDHLSAKARRKMFRRAAHQALGHMGWKETGLVLTLKRVYWNLLTMKNDIHIKAWRWGVRDYCLRRFGPCPDALQKAGDARA